MIPGEDIVTHRAKLLRKPTARLAELIEEPWASNPKWWGWVRESFSEIKEIMEGNKDVPPTQTLVQ